jgi:hypothetical protein
MAITYTNDSASISGTEYYLASDSTTPTYQTTDGIYQLFLDLSALAAADQFRVRLYEKYDSGGTTRLVDEWIFTGAQSKPGVFLPAFTLGEGWEFSLYKIAGTDRTIYWSIRKIA